MTLGYIVPSINVFVHTANLSAIPNLERKGLIEVHDQDENTLLSEHGLHEVVSVNPDRTMGLAEPITLTFEDKASRWNKNILPKNGEIIGWIVPASDNEDALYIPRHPDVDERAVMRDYIPVYDFDENDTILLTSDGLYQGFAQRQSDWALYVTAI